MKTLKRLFRRLRTTRRVGGPTVSDHVYSIIWSVKSPRERAALRRQPLQTDARLTWVARDRGVAVRQIVAEIIGAGTAVGVVLPSQDGPCFALRPMKT